MTKEQIQDKIRGSLVGGAIGDALGYPVEFVYSYEEIVAKYGDEGVVEFDKSYPWLDDHLRYYKALFSDDTQMTLYTAEGLLEAEKSGTPLIPAICNAYLAWLGPQIGRNLEIAYKSELAQIKELNQRRAPGHTCLTSLFSIYSGKEPMNSSKGCGGVMRVAPIGLYGASHDWPLEKTAKIAGKAAELTHKHPMSTYSSAAFAVLCQLCTTTTVVTTRIFKDYVEKMLAIVANVYGKEPPDLEDFNKLIRKAVRLEDNLLRDWEIIENGLGGGWVAEETLAIAIFSVLRHIDDFKGCMICAVNHGGDSDSTGAVAGNISGAILGYGAVSKHFINKVQLQDLLISTADTLCANFEGNEIIQEMSLSDFEPYKFPIEFDGYDEFPNSAAIATKESWDNFPMAGDMVIISIDFMVSKNQMDIIRRGHIPADMDDHWFMYCENNAIHYFRSWSGYPVYSCKYEQDLFFPDKFKLTKLAINISGGYYSAKSIRENIATFLGLLADDCGANSEVFWDMAFGPFDGLYD